MLFRGRDTPLVAWLAWLPLPREPLRAPNAAASLAVGALPDLAWAWSFGAGVALFWWSKPWRASAPWIVAGGALAMFMEVGQALGVVPGTFDRVDLLAIAVGYALGAVIARRHARRVLVTD